ncbi:MAG: CocE/NonD family hydrolase [Thermomicrobiales bacterium]|nr:CocE/NonD family hydrolase [Thermomicrobiales bacterium]
MAADEQADQRVRSMGAAVSDDRVYEVQLIRDVMIPMPDGVRLAGNLFIPTEPGTWPGILSFNPYIKDAYGGQAHEPHHRHFASRGYAVLHVDFRGTGNSEGINPHPFDPQEREDGYNIVEWMAGQPWCTGDIGIWGISYSGITSLSIASTRPPHLRAIVPIHATMDNYEWLHRNHGCRGLLLGDVDWGTGMVVSNLLPPVRQDREGRWERLWHERIEAAHPWFFDWHGSPPDPDFWVRRKIPYEQIEVPTFGICGWYDAYTAPTFTVFEAVQAPKRVLIGPWKHSLADISPVHPIGGVHEMDRWWDRWLKGIENGVELEPPVTIYVMDEERWRHETEWPVARTTPTRLHAQPGNTLSAGPTDAEHSQTYAYDARVGTGSIGYNGHRKLLPIPTDQSADDLMSLTYTSEPLPEAIEITGTPVAHISLSANTPELTLVVKLCAVNARGESRVISEGNRNPARLDAHAIPDPLKPGEIRSIAIPMHPTSSVIQAGDRLRLCIAGADFPTLWPTPNPYDLTIHLGENGTSIDLPIVPPRDTPLPDPVLQPADASLQPVDPASGIDLHVVHQHLGQRVTAFETRKTARYLIDGGGELHSDHHSTVTTNADRPWETNLQSDSRYVLKRGAGDIAVRVQGHLTPFAVRATAEIDIAGQPFFRQEWSKVVDDWSGYDTAADA